MPRGKYLVQILVVVIVCAVTGVAIAQAKTLTTPKKIIAKPFSYLRIFYYQDTKLARASLKQNYASIDVLAPAAYSIDRDGKLLGTVNPTALTVARAHRIKLMPLVINSHFNSSTAASFLSDPVKQDLAVASLVNEAVVQKYWGLQLDFEQVDIAYRDNYSAFVKKLYNELAKNKIKLSVAVIPQVSNIPSDYPKDHWYTFVGVYDFAALASSTDFISLMSYDAPSSTGPIAPYPWLTKVVEYALKFIPPQKLSLGVPLYYWKWNDDTTKLVGIGGYPGIKNTLRLKSAKVGYSDVDQEPNIKYIKNGVHSTIWYENAKSMKKKVDLIKLYKLHGFSAWALGLEVPSIFSAIKR